ncbi:MAG: sterol-binding protein [Frankiaceae bacterium]|nr:sterol-binding protein [Frankiaceae bacterium]MBV9369754.1 sterol-binding protein [Frankiales bacterium]
MATVEQCRVALDDLTAKLAAVEPELRARHVPDRSVSCLVTDLGVTFACRLDEHGVHDLAEGSPDDQADLRLSMTSDVLVGLASGDEDFLSAWLRGRVHVSASMRDLLRLRSLFGL